MLAPIVTQAELAPVEWQGRRAPVLSIREPGDRETAARLIAAGHPAAFYLGLFTIVRTLRPPWEPDRAGLFWSVKPARPAWSKLPMIVPPRHSIRLVDFNRVHPAFRHWRGREHWERLWSSHGAPLHVIAPLRPLRFLHPAFQTSPTDLQAQARTNAVAADRLLPETTASFFWMHDRDWDEFATLAALYAPPHAYLGGTSFNAHGQHPPYTLDELRAVVRDRGELEFDLVVHDPAFEAAGVHSSHTMVRLPLPGEEPALVMTRRGAIGRRWLEDALGVPVRVLESVAAASHHDGIDEAALERALRGFVASRRGRGSA